MLTGQLARLLMALVILGQCFGLAIDLGQSDVAALAEGLSAAVAFLVIGLSWISDRWHVASNPNAGRDNRTRGRRRRQRKIKPERQDQ